jgi:D-alanine--poly(phosphoribitol) ligase subunit 1
MNNLIYSRFLEIVEQCKSRVAVTDQLGGSLTYGELINKADVYSNMLTNLGIVAGDHICIDSEKCTDSIAVLVACWKISCSYTFINCNQPQDRINHILNTSNSKILVSRVQDENSVDKNTKTLEMDSSELPFNFLTLQAERTSSTFANLAYVMFTSGSTGQPKGVGITYEQVDRFVTWLGFEFMITREDRLTSVNPWYFDNSVFDLYLSLLTGATLIICDLDRKDFGLTWVNFIVEQQPTVWFSVPSLLLLMMKLKVMSPKKFGSLRILAFGGEAFPKEQLFELYSSFRENCKVVSVYGPTEGTCICSVNFVSLDDLESEHKYVSLGSFPDFFKFEIRKNLEINQNGFQSQGTLVLSGENMASGYLGGIESERFMKLTNGTYSYNTGDLVYLDPSSNKLYFAGRSDNQIKRNGVRIELEEIESRIELIAGVSGCIAVYFESEVIDLVALVETNNSEMMLQDAITQKLPPNMIPRRIKKVVELPRNANGKKDRFQARESLKE